MARIYSLITCYWWKPIARDSGSTIKVDGRVRVPSRIRVVAGFGSDFSFCSAHLISNALLVFFVLDFQSSPSTAFDRHCVPLLLEPINRDASMEA
ncbi:hypothetical protein SAY86_009013 [Trapa natans]|uniref:Uncharacterized protein n=1 Tax=Trapa natans TaxID=22666 RepID=A0AAN7K9N1_TRANT|nr:hypothetical protein SAY86_009013 [Trapa natans]